MLPRTTEENGYCERQTGLERHTNYVLLLGVAPTHGFTEFVAN